MPRVINQIAGFLKMKLFGQSSGVDVPLAADGDGHLQVDIASAVVNATVDQVTMRGNDGAVDRKVHVDSAGDLQVDILSSPAVDLNAHEAKLMGLAPGPAQKQIAVDGDGDQQVDVKSIPTLTVQFSTGAAAPVEINPGDAGSAGSSSLAAKEDHEHPFPCAAPGTTALGDASAEGSAGSAARSDHKHKYIITGLKDGRFERKDADTGRLTGLAGTSKLIEVGGDYTSLASDIERALTAGNYLLNADGSISAGDPAADATYYVYLLGQNHSTNPNELRYIATAPNSNGYLGTTGDAAHCRHVGWLHTDGSTQIADETCHSRFKGKTASVRNALTSGTYSPGNASTWEDTGVEVDFLWPPGWAAIVEFTSTSYHNTANHNTRVRVHLQQKNEETVEPLATCSGNGIRAVIAGARTWRGGASPVFETAKIQVWTSQVTPGNVTFYKGNTFTDVVVTLIPEEAA
ncbi:MAG: hypothetical protein JRI22_13960 [Deltaproteobacteria bacterium]|nr:hypothetical protein [Deltaproteobacteria bacterium]